MSYHAGTHACIMPRPLTRPHEDLAIFIGTWQRAIYAAWTCILNTTLYAHTKDVPQSCRELWLCCNLAVPPRLIALHRTHSPYRLLRSQLDVALSLSHKHVLSLTHTHALTLTPAHTLAFENGGAWWSWCKYDTMYFYIMYYNLFLYDIYSQSHLRWHFRKLKAQSSNVSVATFQWKETFELWSLNQQSRMSPQVGLAVRIYAYKQYYHNVFFIS